MADYQVFVDYMTICVCHCEFTSLGLLNKSNPTCKQTDGNFSHNYVYSTAICATHKDLRLSCLNVLEFLKHFRCLWDDCVYHMLYHVFTCLLMCFLGGGCTAGVGVWCQGAGAGDCRHCRDRPGRLEEQHRVQRRCVKLQGGSEATEQRCRSKCSWHTGGNVRELTKSSVHWLIFQLIYLFTTWSCATTNPLSWAVGIR